MRVIRHTAVLSATLAAFLSLGSAPACAEDLSYSDLSARIQVLERELSTQQVQLASCDSAAGCCSIDTSTACCETSSWYVGFELTALRPYISNANVPATAFDDEYGFGYRLVAGYDGGSGMGARFRYWFYNHGHDILPTAAGVSVGLDMDVADLEFTLQQQLCNWNLMFSGGVRYGRVGIRGPAAMFGGTTELYFEGVGPTIALEVRREFGDRGLYLIGNARTSLLYGDWNNYLPSGAGVKISDEITTVLENQLGVGYTRNLGRATLTLRTVWETQFWLNDTAADDANGFGSNLAFAGPTSTAELRF